MWSRGGSSLSGCHPVPDIRDTPATLWGASGYTRETTASHTEGLPQKHASLSSS